ncbi:transcriptional regulator [Streptomyces sp. SID4950]|nr:transcriptional regulator [Streptomyces sp. SID4950]
MEDPPTGAIGAVGGPAAREERQALARRVGDYLTHAASAAGFDVRQRAGGRAQLAGKLGVSITTVSRTLEGKTLPLPSQLTTWASVLGLDHQQLLRESGLIPPEPGAERSTRAVASTPPTPDEAMDAWGITDPKIRTMLSGSIEQARGLQRQVDDADRGATARG